MYRTAKWRLVLLQVIFTLQLGDEVSSRAGDVSFRRDVMPVFFPGWL